MKRLQNGQALLTLLIFTIIALTITTAAVIILFTNSLSGTKFQEGTIAYDIAESGLENALIRTMRDTAYTGETLTVGGGTAVTTVTAAYPKTITSVGTNGNFKRTIQVQLNYSGGSYSISNWQEI